jgi:hypothetical protein
MKLIRSFFSLSLCLSLCLCLSLLSNGGAQAEPLGHPVAKPILVISGKIANTNVGDTAQFDRDMLEALGLETVETANPWYDGRVRFEGVSIDKLMRLVGAKGTKVTAVALNDGGFQEVQGDPGDEARRQLHGGS